MTQEYNVVVGMEVHAQLLTKTKMFCRCSADYQGAPPNTHTCPVCLGLPGALPVGNRAAVEATIRTGLALNCEIAETAVFTRKNYHYPDLPKGYQISQYELPLCRNGLVEIDQTDGGVKRIRIHRAHLEEDTGKNTHAGLHTLVDLNRAGMPLLEIVTEADIASADEAYAFLTKLRSILRYLGVNSGNMEEGALRCEPNISVRTPEQAARGELGTKVEVKNLNSLRAVRNAIAYEAERQAGCAGERRRDRAGEYGLGRRPPAHCAATHEGEQRGLPLLPGAGPAAAGGRPAVGGGDGARLARTAGCQGAAFPAGVGLRAEDARTITDEKAVADYFEAAVTAYGRENGNPQRMANWITGELFRLLYADGEGQDLRQIAETRVQPQQLAALVRMVDARQINVNTGKKVLESMYRSGDDPQTVVEREGLAMVSNTSVIDAAVQAAFDDNPDELARYRNGETKLFGFFMGQMMRATKGKADPQAARQRLQEMLDG